MLRRTCGPCRPTHLREVPSGPADRPKADHRMTRSTRDSPSPRASLTGPASTHAPLRADYDPHSTAQRADSYALSARRRDETPVFWSPVMNAWVLTRYDDVVLALTDTKRFSNKGSIGIDAFDTFPAEVQAVFNGGLDRFPGLIEMDPPVHSTYRNLVNLAFTPRRVAALEPRIQQLVDDLIDGFAAAGHADLPTAFAFPFPMLVICEILGVPEGDQLSVQHMADGFRALEA